MSRARNLESSSGFFIMSLVYQHRRLDTGEVFYVGIAESEKRAVDFKRRNNIWKKIASKTEYSVEILHTDLSREEACRIEVELIKQYGRLCTGTGTLSNLSEGGEKSAKGFIHSEETRQRMSASRTGKPRPQSTREAISKGLTGVSKGRQGKPHTEETKRKIAEAHLGKAKPLLTEEHKKKISETQKGRTRPPRTEEHSRNISIGKKKAFNKLKNS